MRARVVVVVAALLAPALAAADRVLALKADWQKGR